jgi:hypothetical protein
MDILLKRTNLDKWKYASDFNSRLRSLPELSFPSLVKLKEWCQTNLNLDKHENILIYQNMVILTVNENPDTIVGFFYP